jgi:thiamine-phosphate diphosphorylase
VPVVHAVTTDAILLRPDFLESAQGIMRALGSRVAVHLRTRGLAAARLHDLALALALAQRRTGAWLLVNDRVDIALATGARGTQLTSRSLRVLDARAIAPGLALGASVHSVEEARAAAADGADWVVAGNVYETPTHPDAAERGPAFVAELSSAVRIPVIAIGGIRPEHVPFLRRAGARGVAAIRGIWDADDAERAAIDYFSSYDAYGGE